VGVSFANWFRGQTTTGWPVAAVAAKRTFVSCTRLRIGGSVGGLSITGVAPSSICGASSLQKTSRRAVRRAADGLTVVWHSTVILLLAF